MGLRNGRMGKTKGFIEPKGSMRMGGLRNGRMGGFRDGRRDGFKSWFH